MYILVLGTYCSVINLLCNMTLDKYAICLYYHLDNAMCTTWCSCVYLINLSYYSYYFVFFKKKLKPLTSLTVRNVPQISPYNNNINFFYPLKYLPNHKREVRQSGHIQQLITKGMSIPKPIWPIN